MRDTPTLRVDLITVGSCRAPEALALQGASWRAARFPAGAALISHPAQGTILFDSGYGSAFFAATRRFPERLYQMLTPACLPADQTLPAHLARLGLDAPAMVVLSHLHADHAAGLFDLAPLPARAVTSARALAGLQAGRMASLRAGCPKDLRDRLRGLTFERIESFAPRALEDFGLGAFGSGHDLFGDGSALSVDLPGHGIGQFGLLLPKTTEGPQFLIADAAWSLRALAENRPPPLSTLQRLGDGAAYMQTFARLRALHRTWPALRLIAAHCPATFADKGPAR